jgi:hypothetical protein
MTQQAYPTLNEFEPSWADIRIPIPLYAGPVVTTDDIAAIKWSDKVVVGAVRGTGGGKKRKRTTGQLENDASITFYLSGWKKMKVGLRTVAPQQNGKYQVSLVAFDIPIQFTPPGSTEIFEVNIKGARIIGRTFDAAEGSDAQKIEIPLDIMQVEEDGDIVLL